MAHPLFAAFSSLEDPRVLRTQRHRFEDILAIAILAVIAGADGWEDIETFGIAKQAWLSTFLPLPNGIPSHDTFARVLSRLDPVPFEACFGQWVQQIAQQIPGEVVALDGKTVRGSTESALERSPLRLVSAWATQQGLLLGQVASDGQGSELQALRQLLGLLDLQDCTVTIDALGCQQDVVETLVRQGATYVLAVKGNQPTLAAAVAEVFPASLTAVATLPGVDCWEQEEQGHGRWERRTVSTLAADPATQALAGWESVQTLIKVETQRSSERGESHERRYFVSNGRWSAEAAAHAIRAHWLIENQLHWVLDITFREDMSRITDEYGAANLALLRRLALILLRNETTFKASVKKKRFRAGLDTAYLERVISAKI